jgi:hypothetical protein
MDKPVMAYSVKLRKMVEIQDMELVTMKNGRPAVRGVAKEDPTSKVFRILGKDDVEEIRQMLGQ